MSIEDNSTGTISSALRWSWWLLLILGPVAYALDHLRAAPVAVFVIAGLGTMPAAALLGRATEEIGAAISAREVRSSGSARNAGLLGAKIGGLLNATFGNVPELIVGILALQHGYGLLVKATIIGSVIGNASFVLGIALFLGGIRNGTQLFDAREVGHHAVLMALTVAGLVLPSLFLTAAGSPHIEEVSLATAVVLLGVYAAYLLYSIGGLQGGRTADTFIEEEGEIVQELIEPDEYWPLRRSIPVLAVATVLVFLAAEALIDTVKPFTTHLGWSPVFVGIVVVPILANIAEHSSAILLALKNKTDMVFGVASGSSIQVAVFVTPLLVFLSLLWHPLHLVFSTVEIAALTVTVAIFYLISRDGESNWLEGIQLGALYLLSAIVFFYIPGQL